ncbi:hypothetical protein [Thalassorhabdomicrobium marinisediminis]|uniref:hypothetical protein n=1 Tax=Thalassorhabdomicrobium marinisediminis TaxID=2170577 RepID=UPI001F547E74|nr:hypothetical protein [Thalassorhabdomicrobium marinisediminis]
MRARIGCGPGIGQGVGRGVRLGVAAIALAGLAGCADLGALGGGGSGPGIRALALMGGAVRVRGPEGYCVDQRASDARRGFAVLAGCALISDQAAVMPTLDGLITVQFGESGSAIVSGNEEAFADFLTSDAGRAVLADDGDASHIADVAATGANGTVVARFEDTSGPAFEGTTGAEWRGFQDIGSRLVTMSVLSFARAPLSRAEGERLLAVAMAELARANAPDAQDAP